MVIQTYSYLLHRQAETYFTVFVFFATLSSYSFHWGLTHPGSSESPRIQWLKKYRWVYPVLFIIGVAGSFYTFFHLIDYWYYLAIAALLTFLYSAPKIKHALFLHLRRLAIGKTIFLAFMWTYVTAALPVIFTGGEWNKALIFFIINRYFLVYAICILFDYRDREDDKAAGIRSLITYLDEKGITLLFYFSIVIAIVAAVALYRFDYNALHVIFLLIPVIITALLYNEARRNFSDILYYLVIDG